MHTAAVAANHLFVAFVTVFIMCALLPAVHACLP